MPSRCLLACARGAMSGRWPVGGGPGLKPSGRSLRQLQALGLHRICDRMLSLLGSGALVRVADLWADSKPPAPRLI